MEIKHFVKEEVEYHQLYGECPECSKNADFWVCGECGGDIYLGDNAHIYCSKCKKDFKAIYAHYICPCCSSGVLCNTVVYTPRPNSLSNIPLPAAGIDWLCKFVQELKK